MIFRGCGAERVEGWKDGRMEGWKDGRMEEWKSGRMSEAAVLVGVCMWGQRQQDSFYQG
jgi:hypothetical protein